jgi:hypothetical protein
MFMLAIILTTVFTIFLIATARVIRFHVLDRLSEIERRDDARGRQVEGLRAAVETLAGRGTPGPAREGPSPSARPGSAMYPPPVPPSSSGVRTRATIGAPPEDETTVMESGR